MNKTLVIKQLPDGSGRTCIHWLIRDDEGPVKMESCQIQTPYKSGGNARIACNDEQNTVTPQERGREVFLCMRTDDVRAATCPKCLATTEAKLMLAHYAEMEEQPLSEENIKLLQESRKEAETLRMKLVG